MSKNLLSKKSVDMSKEAFESIDRRLPKSDWVSISDVASAFSRSVGIIYGWMQDGRITGLNSGTEGRGSYMIYRPSVIRFAQESLGIETKG